MGTNTNEEAANRAFLVLVGVFLGLTCFSFIAMRSTNCFAIGFVGTPIYLAAHYLSLSVGRRILRDRATVGRFLLCAFVVFFLYLTLPFGSLVLLGVRDDGWLLVAATLAFVGTSIVYERLSHADEPAPSIKPRDNATDVTEGPTFIQPFETSVDGPRQVLTHATVAGHVLEDSSSRQDHRPTIETGQQ